MASNWAIVIGINQYRFLQPLNYAKRDAEAMHRFLMQEAKFDRIFLFTDDSPAISGKSTEPFRANLLRVLRQIFAAPFMKDGDNFWFFFSGHGIPHNGQDYLMPLDGDPEDVENTGISTNTITNYLRSCGADNAVMILDACRSGGKKSGEGIGRQTEAEARQTGVISFFSCSPDQYSYELEAIGQGAFTYALLEGLGIRGRCATVERLNQYLEHRVPELVNQHLQRVRQIPYTIAEPLNRSHLILMPQHASLADIATLKNDAYRAQMKQDWDLAQRLWIRVLAAASGSDMEAIEALQNLVIQRHAGATLPQPEPRQTSESYQAPANPETLQSKSGINKSSTLKGLADLFGKAPPQTPPQQPIRGDDLRQDLRLDFREAVFGGKKEIRISRLETCGSCAGKGFQGNLKGHIPCPVCHTKRRVESTKKLLITIPAGVDTGTRLLVRGESDAGQFGGAVGDLYIYLFVNEDEQFKRDGINILSNIKITPEQAASGCKLAINTIDGSGFISIPEGTKHRTILRLRDRGVPKLGNSTQRGDHLVTVSLY